MTRNLRIVGAGALLLLLALATSNCGAPTGLVRPEGKNLGAAPAPDRLDDVAARYAPWFLHAVDARRFREDLPSNVDFDGNLVGNDTWETFPDHRLLPTVYFAALETETHWFLAYHLFHPRDWAPIVLWLNDTHENDGENCQVVVRKSDGRVVLAWAQHHYRSHLFAWPGAGISAGRVAIRGSFDVVDDRGVPGDDPALGFTHAVFFVESQGHGIYGAADSCSGAQLARDGTVRFDSGSGLVLRPARPGEVVEEPVPGAGSVAPYRLDSITGKLWPLLRDGALVGDGKLLDGPWAYRDEQVSVGVPRYYDADRFSGPFGSDRGISPFALDFEWKEGTLGALFFDPARRYAEMLTIEGPWSLEYVEFPFR